METARNRINEDHDELVITANSATEAGNLERTFPRSMPSTHTLQYEWVDKVMPSKQIMRSLHIKPVPKEEGAQAEAAAEASSPRKALEALKVEDLKTKAVELGLTVDPKAKKADLVASILEKQQAPAEAATPGE